VKSDWEYFSIGNGKKYKDQLTAKEWQDLIDLRVMPMVLLF
jgi:dGTPase